MCASETPLTHLSKDRLFLMLQIKFHVRFPPLKMLQWPPDPFGDILLEVCFHNLHDVHDRLPSLMHHKSNLPAIFSLWKYQATGEMRKNCIQANKIGWMNTGAAGQKALLKCWSASTCCESRSFLFLPALFCSVLRGGRGDRGLWHSSSLCSCNTMFPSLSTTWWAVQTPGPASHFQREQASFITINMVTCWMECWYSPDKAAYRNTTAQIQSAYIPESVLHPQWPPLPHYI